MSLRPRILGAADAAAFAALLLGSIAYLMSRELPEPEAVAHAPAMVFMLALFARGAATVILSFVESYLRPEPAPLRRHPLVSVIVPCYNEEKVIQAALRSLLRIRYPNLEIIVVDDGSKDQTFAAARQIEREGPVRVVHQPNQGKAKALNHGISLAQGDYVLCVDADGVIAPDSILQGLPLLLGDPRIAAVAGHVAIANTGRQGNWLTAFQELEYLVGLNFQKPAQSALSAVTVIPGPIGLFRRSAIESVGGYRSHTFAEDADLTVRLLVAGYRVVYCPRMIALTEAPEDFASLIKQRYRWTRGTLQVLKSELGRLARPGAKPRASLVLAYLAAESILLPMGNLVFGVAFLEEAFSGRVVSALDRYFLPLVALELLLTAFALLNESGRTRLLLLSGINRFTYGLATEVLRCASMLDEALGLPMGWNKLQRKGK